MNGLHSLDGITFNWSTLIRLALAIALALAVRQAVLHFGRKAVEKRKGQTKGKRGR